MPRWIYTAIIMVNLLMIIPPVLIFKARSEKSRNPRIHLFPDMDNQQRFKEQSENPLFADQRAMRLPVDGTVARGELYLDDHYYRGRTGDAWATTFPSQIAVNEAVLDRGRDRYGIYCTPCHGISGHGDGMVRARSLALEQTWDILDLNTQKARDYPVGHLFNAITNGINTMPSYRSAVTVEDRWAIVAWVRALQFSQAVEVSQVPPEVQGDLNASKPREPEPTDESAPKNPATGGSNSEPGGK